MGADGPLIAFIGRLNPKQAREDADGREAITGFSNTVVVIGFP